MIEDRLTTEARNPRSDRIDALSALEIVELMNDEDFQVVQAVRSETKAIALAVETVADRFRQGGRLIYVGAGTSGRLGVLDASECPPTFGTPPSMVVGLIAGGRDALTRSIEGAEDDPREGAKAIRELNVGSLDVVAGIAASGRTPYVIGAVDEARSLGAYTVAVVCNKASVLGSRVDLEIAVEVGPEIVAGSTRLKSGTATKMVLNMITTGALIRIGKTYGNRMVDLTPVNEKLRIRSRRMVRELTGVDDDRASLCLQECGWQVKPALIRAMTSVEPDEARRLLDQHGGQIRQVLLALGHTPPNPLAMESNAS